MNNAIRRNGQALGRGTQELMENYRIDPSIPGERKELSDDLKTGQAIYVILEALSGLPEAYQEAAFESVRRVRRAEKEAKGETVAEISNDLNAMERKRQLRQQSKPGFIRRLFGS